MGYTATSLAPSDGLPETMVLATQGQIERGQLKLVQGFDNDCEPLLTHGWRCRGPRYQTLLNQLLRQALIGDTKTILERLEKLEKAVFKTRAA